MAVWIAESLPESDDYDYQVDWRWPMSQSSMMWNDTKTCHLEYFANYLTLLDRYSLILPPPNKSHTHKKETWGRDDKKKLFHELNNDMGNKATKNDQ
jgi:hypothetical protein